MIRVSHLFKAFNGQEVLKDVNLEINDGEILAVLGQSGSGKSVLLRHLIGLMKPDQGRIEINGDLVTELPEKELLKVRKKIGYLFQDGALYDFMSVFENIAFPLREHTKLDGLAIRKKITGVLKMIGLEGVEGKYPSELSGGMRKRVALARAIILDSKTLFCDEPTSGLDPIRSRDISDLIRDVSRQFQCTTVIASHDIDNSFRIADRLILINEGKIVIAGSPEQLRASKDNFVQEFIR